MSRGSSYFLPNEKATPFFRIFSWIFIETHKKYKFRMNILGKRLVQIKIKDKHTRNIISTVIDWSKRSQPAYSFKAAMEAPEQWVQSFQT